MAKRLVKGGHDMSVVGPHKPKYDFSKKRARTSAPHGEYTESLNAASAEAGYGTPWQVTQRAQRGRIDARRKRGKYGPVWFVTKKEKQGVVETGSNNSATVSQATEILRRRGINVAPNSIQRYAHKHLIPHSIGPGKRVLVPRSYLQTDEILSVREGNLESRQEAAAVGRTLWGKRYRRGIEKSHVRISDVPDVPREDVLRALRAEKDIGRRKFRWANELWVQRADIGKIENVLKRLDDAARQTKPTHE